MAPISVIWIVLSGMVAISRHSRWVSVVWFPTVVVSAFFSLYVVLIIFSGGYGLLALPVWGAFPLITILLFVARPTGPFGGARWMIGSALFAVIAIVLFFVPRPNGIALRLKIIEGEQKPVAHTTIPIFIYHGVGGNDDLRLRTDGNGMATLRVYYPESGSIALEDAKDPRRDRKIHFEPWTPIVGGPPNGYKFDGKDVIAGNSDQVFTIYWSDKRDMAQRRTEPMYVFRADGKLETNPATLVLNAETGKFGDDGDITFTIRIESRVGPSGSDLAAVTEVVVAGGAAVHAQDHRFMDVAPEDGYTDRLVFSSTGTDRNFAFYLRTRSGRYAVIGVEVSIYGLGGVGRPFGFLHVGVRYNPSGSRHVEFDHTKWLNRN